MCCQLWSPRYLQIKTRRTGKPRDLQKPAWAACKGLMPATAGKMDHSAKTRSFGFQSRPAQRLLNTPTLITAIVHLFPQLKEDSRSVH
jgi:hypothetical protein